jgi:hypothetical protein
MKPDFGLDLQSRGIGRDVALKFYGVPFRTIDFLAPSSYSTMLEHEHAGTVFAVSFDFGDDVFAVLISKIAPELRNAFGNSIIGKSFPFSADLPDPVEATTLECRLGSIQTGAHDSFVPLVVVGIS